MIIRDVEDKDASFVRKFAHDFMEYYPTDIDYKEHSLLRTLEYVSEEGIFFVAVDGEEVIGTIGALIAPHFYAMHHLSATELFLWVREDHRNKSVGPRLLQAYEEEAQKRGCKYITMSSTSNTPKFGSFLERKGYTRVEESFVKEIV